MILNEINRCCETLQEAGGDTVVIAGDLFHVRGKLTPSVFNPVRWMLEKWMSKGVFFQVIPGNHDLESDDSKELSSAVSMLSHPNWLIEHEPIITSSMAMVPWIKEHHALLNAIERLRELARADGMQVANIDLFLHAGIDGVLSGVPASGLTVDKLATFGFRRVFAGHYHHHVHLGDGVFSVGSPTHQTWSDIGTKSGWLIVDMPGETKNAGVKWYSTHAPQFVEITSETDEAMLPLLVDGHYVRARIGQATPAQIKHWQDELKEMGAKGVLIQSSPAPVMIRTSAVSGLSRLPDMVTAFCSEKGFDPIVAEDANNLLVEASS